MEFINFNTSVNDEGRRFDSLIRKFLPQMPLSLIYKNIRTGFIRLNNKKSKQEVKIQVNDTINIEKHLYEKFTSQNSSIGKNSDKDILKNTDFINQITLFKNNSILILDKPYNINVQNSQKDDESLDKIIKSIYKKDSLTFMPGPMHRLDKLTTGVLCFSQNIQCARWFSEQIANHTIQKYYLAILEGKLSEKQEWIDYLTKESQKTDSFYKSVVSDEQKGKKSITIVEPISYGIYKDLDITFVKIFIPTGRNHQIRLQCSNHGFPLLQDNLYDSKISKIKNEFAQKLYLHCYKLIFPENDFEIPKEITSPLPISFKNTLKKCLIETTNQVYTR